MLRVANSSRYGHLLWADLLFLPLALAIFGGVIWLIEVTDSAKWPSVPALLLLFAAYEILAGRVIKIRQEWHITLTNGQDLTVDVFSYSTISPFGKYVVLVEGERQALKRVSWWPQDRFEFQLGHEPAHRAQVSVSGLTLWPIVQEHLDLEIDDQQLVQRL